MKTPVSSFRFPTPARPMRLSVFLVVAGCGFFACKKNDPEAKPSQTALLAAKAWIVRGATIDGTNVYASLDPCNKDDLFRYVSDGTYALDEGATKCDAGDPQVFAKGTWSFDEATNVLTMTQTSGNGFSGQINVTELKADRLVMEYNVTIGGTRRKIVQQLEPSN